MRLTTSSPTNNALSRTVQDTISPLCSVTNAKLDTTSTMWELVQDCQQTARTSVIKLKPVANVDHLIDLISPRIVRLLTFASSQMELTPASIVLKVFLPINHHASQSIVRLSAMTEECALNVWMGSQRNQQQEYANQFVKMLMPKEFVQNASTTTSSGKEFVIRLEVAPTGIHSKDALVVFRDTSSSTDSV